MANLSLGFNLSANAAGMAQGINAGVVELQKLGLAAKQTQSDVRLLTGLQLGTAFIGGIRALSAAIGQANQLLSGFVNESVSIGEEAQKANVIFEGSAAAIQEFARSSTGIGLSTNAALQATASFGNLFTAIGLNNRQAADYSQTLTVLAADLASFNNTSVEDAVLALGSALRGESEPIRRYGVLLSDATLKQTAQANGFQVTSGALTPVVRAQAAYLAILQQTSKAQGDFERTSDSLANQQRILGAEWNNVRAVIGDALQPAYRAIVQALRDSLPAIRQAGEELARFVANADFSALTLGAVSAFTQFAAAGQLLINVLGPALQKPLVAVGLGLAFINRQAIATGIANLASAFAAARAAANGYSIALATATVVTKGFTASLRALAAATLVGVIVVGLGLAAEAALQYGTSGTSAAEDVKQEVVDMTKAIQLVTPQFETAGNAAQQFGAKVQAAVKIPEISIADIAQDSINSAQSAIAGLAKELGGTVNLPKEMISDFIRIQNLAQRANGDLVNQSFLLQQLVQESNRFADSIKGVAERRQEDTRAAKQAADANRKAAEDARKRTSDLALEGLGGGEQSRLKLAQDLLAIDRERKSAEEALAAARRGSDNAGIAAARERLKLVGDAAATAREQDRGRQLQALGIDNDLLKPAKTIAAEFAKVRDAFRQGLIDPDEAKNALRNLADEGIKIRADLNAELARPSQQALEVQDIRNGGIAEFLRLATGREDPAIEQNRQQLQELSRIRQGLERIGVRAVDILGS